MENFIGEFTALGAALAYSFTSTFFTLAGRKLNAVLLLASSMFIACVVLMFVHLALFGEMFPFSASFERWMYLGASSITGFVISSIFLLRSFQYIGPRLTFLITSLAPVLATILAWMFLDQALQANSIVGIVIVITGIISVVTERKQQKVEDIDPDYRKGLLFAFIGSFGQAISFVLMSKGVEGDFEAMSASVMRTFVAATTLWIVIALQGNLSCNFRLIKQERRALEVDNFRINTRTSDRCISHARFLTIHQCRYFVDASQYCTHHVDTDWLFCF